MTDVSRIQWWRSLAGGALVGAGTLAAPTLALAGWSAPVTLGGAGDGVDGLSLAASAADAIGSVARYLNYFGWERGAPTHFDVRAPDNAVDRALLRAATVEVNKLEKQVTFLATTASLAPFVGLFGTVWGIMSAFAGIGAEGSTDLAVVAPGIAEALVATAVGLFAPSSAIHVAPIAKELTTTRTSP